jgi:chromosome segregation ATPase
MATVKQDVSELKSEMATVKQDISRLNQEVIGLKYDVTNLKQDVTTIKANISNVEKEIANVNVTLETVTNRNIQIIAEGHADLARRFDDALKVENEKELLLIRINVLENELKQIKEKLTA